MSWSHIWDSTCHYFCIMYTFQYWSLFARWYRSGIILGFWKIHLVWKGILILTQNQIDKCLNIGEFKILFDQFLLKTIKIFLESISGLLVGINRSLHYKDLVVQLFPTLFFPLGILNVEYEDQGRRNRPMVINNWCYLTQVCVNRQITW